MRRLLSRLRFAFWCWVGRRIPAAAYWAKRADAYRQGQLAYLKQLVTERKRAERLTEEVRNLNGRNRYLQSARNAMSDTIAELRKAIADFGGNHAAAVLEVVALRRDLRKVQAELAEVNAAAEGRDDV